MENDQTLRAIRYQRGSLSILDQLKLPEQSIYIPIQTADDAWKAIHTMSIRGIPTEKRTISPSSTEMTSRFRCTGHCGMWRAECCD